MRFFLFNDARKHPARRTDFVAQVIKEYKEDDKNITNTILTECKQRYALRSTSTYSRVLLIFNYDNRFADVFGFELYELPKKPVDAPGAAGKAPSQQQASRKRFLAFDIHVLI